MIFSAISIVSSFEADDTNDLVGVGWRGKKCMLCCALLMQLGLKRIGENCTAQLIYPVRNGMVWYAAVSTHTFWDLFI